MPDATIPELPSEGGSYLRDPKTGALMRQPDDAAPPGPGPVPVPPEVQPEGGK